MDKTQNAFSKCFSERLYRLRQDKGLNQTQLAKALGVSRSAIAFYENGQRTPDIAFLARVSNYFGVSCDYLLGKEIYSKPEYTQIVRRLGLWDKNIELLMTLDNQINKAKAAAGSDSPASSSDTLNLLNLFIFVFFKGVGVKKNALPRSIEKYLTYTSGGKAKKMAARLAAELASSPQIMEEEDKIEDALISYAQKEMTDAFLEVIEGMKEEYLLKKKTL